jgi:hypothetical protein
MAIKYFVQRHTITGKTNKKEGLRPRIKTEGKIGYEEFVRKLEEFGHINKGTAMQILETTWKFLRIELAEGRVIDLGPVTFKVSLKGSIQSLDQKLNKKKTKLDVIAHVKKDFSKSVASGIKLSRIQANPVLPRIKEITSLNKSVSDGIKKADLVSVIGQHLKIGKLPEEGIFLVSAKSKSEIKITTIAMNTGKNLIFQIPKDLPSGAYSVLVRKAVNRKLLSHTYGKSLNVG